MEKTKIKGIAPKLCPHANTIQVGNPGIIETFCADCGECINVVKTRKK